MDRTHILLQRPSTTYKDAYQDLLQEYRESEEEPKPWVLALNPVPFEHLVETLHNQEKGLDLPPGYIPHTTFWLMRNDRRILGAVNIRHDLNDGLRRIGGHIGYGIRPSERKKGYATFMLKLALVEAQNLEIQHVLLTCDAMNIASATVMRRNGAVLDSEDYVEGRNIQRYWIHLETSR